MLLLNRHQEKGGSPATVQISRPALADRSDRAFRLSRANLYHPGNICREGRLSKYSLAEITDLPYPYRGAKA